MRKSLQGRMFKSIMRWQQSGLTQKAWCEKNDMAYSRFHYWYKRYRREELRDARDQEGSRFVPLMVESPPTAGTWCELLLPEGKKLSFHQAVSAEFLRSLIG
jgi:hypothetical protein